MMITISTAGTTIVAVPSRRVKRCRPGSAEISQARENE
jgi:hypothetical protein